jgi:hypothetical protein
MAPRFPILPTVLRCGRPYRRNAAMNTMSTAGVEVAHAGILFLGGAANVRELLRNKLHSPR